MEINRTISLICIECPRGCNMSVDLDKNNNVCKLEGNFCPKGKQYAISECNNPVRIVTSTIRLQTGEMLSVKTSKGVLKTRILEVMRLLNNIKACKPIKTGQILMENIDGDNTNIIATKTII